MKKLQGRPECFSPDGKLILTTNSAVMMWSVATGELLWRHYPLHNPCCIGFLPDSSAVAISNRFEINLISSNSGEVQSRIKPAPYVNESSGDTNFLLSDDGTCLVGVYSASPLMSHVVRTWDGREVFREQFQYQMTTHILRHPSGSIWFAQNSTHGAPSSMRKNRLIGRCWPFVAGVYDEIVVPWEGYSRVTFSPDGNSLLTEDFYPFSELTVYQFPSLKKVASVRSKDEKERWRGAKFSPCGTRILTSTETEILIFNASDLSAVSRVSDFPAGRVVFSQDRSLLIRALITKHLRASGV
jgi:hypothetical protein